MAKQACNSVKYNGPEEYPSNDVDSYVGRFMCGQHKGKECATFTDQRVIVSGAFVYVITSELRTPPTAVAGVLSFDREKKEGLKQFIERQKQSANVVRASVKVSGTTAEQCL